MKRKRARRSTSDQEDDSNTEDEDDEDEWEEREGDESCKRNDSDEDGTKEREAPVKQEEGAQEAEQNQLREPAKETEHLNGVKEEGENGQSEGQYSHLLNGGIKKEEVEMMPEHKSQIGKEGLGSNLKVDANGGKMCIVYDSQLFYNIQHILSCCR